jgi:hypothetical protein
MCLDNQRCAGIIQHMQNVSLEVELRRRIAAQIAKPDTLYFSPKIGLSMVKIWLDELCPSPDYSRCDNPPGSQ